MNEGEDSKPLFQPYRSILEDGNEQAERAPPKQEQSGNGSETPATSVDKSQQTTIAPSIPDEPTTIVPPTEAPSTPERTPFTLPTSTCEKPPFFTELGRRAFELFNKGFTTELIKVEDDRRSPYNVNIRAGGFTSIRGSRVQGYLEGKQTFSDLGLEIVGKCNTDKSVLTEVSVPSAGGWARVTVNYVIPAAPLPQRFGIKGEVSGAHVSWNAESDLNRLPYFQTAAVFGANGYYAGAQTGYFFQDRKVAPSKLLLSYMRDDFALTGSVLLTSPEHPRISAKSVSCSISQKVTDKIESGSEFVWSSTTAAPSYGLVLQYNLPFDCWLKAKVDNFTRLGLSYSQLLTEGVTLHLSALVEGQNIRSGNHKVGFGIEFNM